MNTVNSADVARVVRRFATTFRRPELGEEVLRELGIVRNARRFTITVEDTSDRWTADNLYDAARSHIAGEGLTLVSVSDDTETEATNPGDFPAVLSEFAYTERDDDDDDQDDQDDQDDDYVWRNGERVPRDTSPAPARTVTVDFEGLPYGTTEHRIRQAAEQFASARGASVLSVNQGWDTRRASVRFSVPGHYAADAIRQAADQLASQHNARVSRFTV